MRSKVNLTNHNIRLTSAEIANLWGAYMGNSMTVCILQYFNQHLEDKEIKEVVVYAPFSGKEACFDHYGYF